MQPYHLLFVSILDETRASHRFRVAKLLPLLQSDGVNVGVLRFHERLEPLAIPRLAVDLRRHAGMPCIVVFQKTIAFRLANLARRLGAHVVMDRDDFSMQRIDGTWYSERSRQINERWIQTMDRVVISCEEMRHWIEPWNTNISLIPTCLDVETYEGIVRPARSRAVIGWTGSGPSKVYLAPIEPALFAATSEADCEVLIVGDQPPQFDSAVAARYQPWQLGLEPSIFGDIDIGIMPLPDNERARMKAGFKLLQYMAAGLPVVASPVGVNKDIVRHGWNGFLADTPEEWESALLQLVHDPALRVRMGQNGKGFVRENYRLQVAAALWRKTCEELIKTKDSSKN